MRIVLIIIAGLGLCCGELFQSANAAQLQLPDWMYGDGNISLSYSKATIIQGADAPTLGQAGIGLTGGYRFEEFFGGLTTDFRISGQYSDVKPTVGNARGTRWNIVSPTIGWHRGNLLIKGDVQFLGSYRLRNDGPGGATISYTSPIGGRVVGMYRVFEKIHAGLFYELVSFSKQNNSLTGETSLENKLKLWQTGLTASYVF